MVELLTYYVIAGALIIGAPAIFFLIAFMPALQNTKGRMVGYKDHKTYGDSSIYENTPGDEYQVLSHTKQLTMTASIFTISTIAFFVLLAYSVEQLSETF